MLGVCSRPAQCSCARTAFAQVTAPHTHTCTHYSVPYHGAPPTLPPTATTLPPPPPPPKARAPTPSRLPCDVASPGYYYAETLSGHLAGLDLGLEVNVAAARLLGQVLGRRGQGRAAERAAVGARLGGAAALHAGPVEGVAARQHLWRAGAGGSPGFRGVVTTCWLCTAAPPPRAPAPRFSPKEWVGRERGVVE